MYEAYMVPRVMSGVPVEVGPYINWAKEQRKRLREEGLGRSSYAYLCICLLALALSTETSVFFMVQGHRAIRVCNVGCGGPNFSATPPRVPSCPTEQAYCRTRESDMGKVRDVYTGRFRTVGRRSVLTGVTHPIQPYKQEQRRREAARRVIDNDRLQRPNDEGYRISNARG
ncbi:hypothetical protein BC834DRAFT_911909 [Gloeopeniophorella convolvens]|nr:hypothetical protein BC834DRAFT_911909 [Gloeopeniophorella convolvens]